MAGIQSPTLGNVGIGSGNSIEIQETVPTDSTKNNGSYVLSKNAAGELVYVDETIGATTYRTTFTRSDMTIATTLPISGAVAQ